MAAAGLQPITQSWPHIPSTSSICRLKVFDADSREALLASTARLGARALTSETMRPDKLAPGAACRDHRAVRACWTDRLRWCSGLLNTGAPHNTEQAEPAMAARLQAALTTGRMKRALRWQFLKRSKSQIQSSQIFFGWHSWRIQFTLRHACKPISNPTHGRPSRCSNTNSRMSNYRAG